MDDAAGETPSSRLARLGRPGTDSYSVDTPKNSVYVFFDASDERSIITLDYTMETERSVQDVGEVYWQYIGAQWEVASDDVTMTLALPVPQDVAVLRARTCAPGDTGRSTAWSLNADGTVDYKIRT